MLSVVQRVARASVRVDGRVTGAIERGLLALVGVHRDDGDADITWMAERLIGLRVFPDAEGKMNLSVGQPDPRGGPAGGGILLAPNFTLCGQTGKGHRPSFTGAMAPERAKDMFETLCLRIAASGVTTAMGVFGADMQIELLNDGPVTLILDSAGARPREVTKDAS